MLILDLFDQIICNLKNLAICLLFKKLKNLIVILFGFYQFIKDFLLSFYFTLLYGLFIKILFFI